MKRLRIIYDRWDRMDGVTVHLKTQLSADEMYKAFCGEVPGQKNNGWSFALWMEKNQLCDIPTSFPPEIFDIRKPLES